MWGWILVVFVVQSYFCVKNETLKAFEDIKNSSKNFCPRYTNNASAIKRRRERRRKTFVGHLLQAYAFVCFCWWAFALNLDIVIIEYIHGHVYYTLCIHISEDFQNQGLAIVVPCLPFNVRECWQRWMTTTAVGTDQIWPNGVLAVFVCETDLGNLTEVLASFACLVNSLIRLENRAIVDYSTPTFRHWPTHSLTCMHTQRRMNSKGKCCHHLLNFVLFVELKPG